MSAEITPPGPIAANAARIGRLHAMRSQLFGSIAQQLQQFAQGAAQVAQMEQTAAVAFAYTEDLPGALQHGERAHRAAAEFIGGCSEDFAFLGAALQRELAGAERASAEGT